MNKREGVLFAVIPAAVLYDESVPAAARLLYGEIAALCCKEGYCFASNGYFADIHSVQRNAVSRWIASLVSAGHITTEIETEEGNRRKIFLVHYQSDPITKKGETPITKKGETPITKKGDHMNTRDYKYKKDKDTHTETPSSPAHAHESALPSDDGERAEDRFDEFWNLYDRKEGSRKITLSRWKKLSKKKRVLIFEHVPRFLQAQPEKRYRPYPEKYLSQEYWLRDLEPQPNGKATPTHRLSAQERRNQLTAATINASTKRTLENIASGRPLLDF